MFHLVSFVSSKFSKRGLLHQKLGDSHIFELDESQLLQSTRFLSAQHQPSMNQIKGFKCGSRNESNQ
jgi:hypothetical protein